MTNDSDDRRRRAEQPLLSADAMTSSSFSSSSSGDDDGPAASRSKLSDYLPPPSSSSTSVPLSDRLAPISGASSAMGGAPPSLPASMPPSAGTGTASAGARRRARVSLRDYLEKTTPGGELSEEDEEEEEEEAALDKAERKSKSKLRGRSRSRSRVKSKTARSVRSRGTGAKSLSSVQTDATGLISVREVRKAWGAMFFAAVMGSFVGTGGLHRLMNPAPPPPPASSSELNRVPPPPEAGGLRGKKIPPQPRAFDYDTEGYEDAMDMIAANNAAQSRDRVAAARAQSELQSMLPPELRTKTNVKALGVDEEAMRDMEILRDAMDGARSKAGLKEEDDVNDGDGGLLEREGQKLAEKDSGEDEEGETKKEPVFGHNVVDDGKGLSDDEEDDDADKVKNDDDDGDKDSDGKDGEGEEKKGGGGYAPVSGKRPHRNGDGTVPDAAKP